MKKFITFRNRTRGFSLVELMVALTIGLIILAAVSTLFVNSKQSYTTQDSLARLQESARFAMHFLIKDLRLAGYYGCVSDIAPESVFSTLNGSDFAYNVQIPLEGVNNIGGTEANPSGQWYPSANTVMPANAMPGTDAVAIRLADSSSPVYLREEMPNTSAVLKVSATTGISDNDVIMISDCFSADILQVTQINSTDPHLVHNTGVGVPGNAQKELSKSYSPTNGPGGTRVMRFKTNTYFIRTGASGNPALFRRENNGTPVELVDGIEHLQIVYGVDTDGDKVPNRYLKAGDAGLATAAEWDTVVSVRLGILATTLDDAATGKSKEFDRDTNNYDVDGDCAPNAALTDACFELSSPNDRYKRRLFQTVVQLRNL
ncbi:MAG: PilW family protein [Gammaproteobacteria bacterium]|nr:PilW family protein [Gammaproteobacteria bacterium]